MKGISTLWQGIVAATADLGPEATALRIPLLVEFRMPPRIWRNRIGAAIETCAPFLTLRRKAGIEDSARGRVLFCFPHRTDSNINNLLPVAREALRRGLLGGILTARDLSAELREFVGVVPIVSAEDLVRQLGMLERVRNATRVANGYKQITEALSRHVPGFEWRVGVREWSESLSTLFCMAQFASGCSTVGHPAALFLRVISFLLSTTCAVRLRFGRFHPLLFNMA
jgi:hypothetical protein